MGKVFCKMANLGLRFVVLKNQTRLINKFSKYLLGTYFVLGPVLCARHTVKISTP